MHKYRKKPVEIEAWQFKGGDQIVPDFIRLSLDVKFTNDGSRLMVPLVRIKTPKGETTAERGDWIIKDQNGDFWPCSPHAFAATYERAD